MDVNGSSPADGSGGWRGADALGIRSGLDVKLLGSVRVFLDGRPVALRGPRVRRLLALLALQPNEMVPMDRIVEGLWGEESPSSVRQQVYNVVATLRGVLAGHAEIERSGSGYELVLDDERIDVVRFQLGVSRASAAGGPAAAVGLVEAALGEWRGPALADLDGVVLERAAAQLEEQRLMALEGLAGSLLQVGDASGAAASLTPLVKDHPFRESLRALLVRSLHRAGRRAEALAVFEEGRRVLSEELGVDPGAALQEAYQELVRGEPEPECTGKSADRDPPTARRAPRQLPADVRVLVGRDRELAELTDLAREVGAGGLGLSPTVSAIDGMGGVGKSALAVRAAHLVRDRFPDGQLYVDLHGHTSGMIPVEPGDALAHFLQALGVEPQQVPDDVDMRAACFRDRLADTRTLLVLDNAMSTAQVTPLLPGTAGCMVLVTSRRRLAGLGDAHQISLGSLPEKVAVDLLRGAADLVLVGDGYEAAAELVAVCGCLPLAIRIVAARLKHNRALTARLLTAELREEEGRLGRLSDGERELTGVFDSSIKVLPPEGRRLYRLLGLVPGPDFDAYAAANLLATDLHSAERLLRTLFDHNLLLQPTAGRYKFHDLLHAHASSLVVADALGPEALDRLLDYYLLTAWAADEYQTTRSKQSGLGDAHDVRVAPTFSHQDQASAWLRAEQPNLLATLSVSRFGPARAMSLTRAVSSHLMHEGTWSLAAGLHRRAIVIARELGDRLAEADALLESAAVVERQGQLSAAVDEASQALAIYRDIDDRVGEAHALSAIGQVAFVQGRHSEASALYESALEGYGETGDRRATAKALWRLGSILSYRGENSKAADRVSRAIALFRDLGDDRAEEACLLTQSRILYALCDFSAVRPVLDRALFTARRCRHAMGVANVLQEIATCQVRAGEYSEAFENLNEALQINREIGFPLGEGYDYLLLGRVSAATGDLDRALQLENEALGIFRRINAVYEASALESLARIHHRRGDLVEASASIAAALSLFEGDKALVAEIRAEVHNEAAALKLDMEGPASALLAYEAVAQMAARDEVPLEHARALEGVSCCELRLGRNQPGVERLREAVDWYQRIGAAEYAPAATRLAALLGGAR